jgi:hypothetical protein
MPLVAPCFPATFEAAHPGTCGTVPDFGMEKRNSIRAGFADVQKVGDTVTLTVQRQGQEVEVRVTLADVE